MNIHIHELITPERIRCDLDTTSKKRLLEELAALLCAHNTELDEVAAFQSLFERERLGSTGLGSGVAIPHGRMRGLTQAVGAFAVLKNEMDFDAIDNKPVKLVFALLVPEEATGEHLQLLSQIAALLSKDETRVQLLNAASPDAIHRLLQDTKPEVRQAS